MHNNIKFILLIPFFLILTACATVISGTSQVVTVQAMDEQDNSFLRGVSCIVTDGRGNRYPFSGNPGSLSIKKGLGGLLVDCKKDGYHQGNVSVGSQFNAITLINLLAWPGFIVDGITGAYTKYPSQIVVLMSEEQDVI